MPITKIRRSSSARRFHFITACLLVQAQTGCVSLPGQQPEIVASPVFDPLIFFAGRTEGHGILKKILSAPVSVTVHGLGVVNEAGVLTLDQEVLEGEKPARKRSWIIRRTGCNSYGGTLSDAKGPVTISINGNMMHIAFTMEGGFPVDQYIFLAADGQSAKNNMQVKKLGKRVAVLEEEIVKTSE